MAGFRVRVVERSSGQLEKFERAVRSASSVTVGIHDSEGAAQRKELQATNKKRPDGSLKYKAVQSEENVSLIEVVMAHELGVGTPRRSIIGDWFDEKVDTELRVKLKAGLLETVKRGQTVEQGLARFGAWAAGSVKRRVVAGIMPPLSKRRLAEKAAVNAKSTPLIYTGQILSSIMSKMEKR